MEVPESWREYACATVFNYSPRELDMILQVLSFSRQLVAALESHREELAGKLAGTFYDETQEFLRVHVLYWLHHAETPVTAGKPNCCTNCGKLRLIGAVKRLRILDLNLN